MKKEQQIASEENISKIKRLREKPLSAENLVEGITKGDKTALARAITLVESSVDEHLEKAEKILEKCLAVKSKSVRIGITGVPGVGKSTFIEVFGKMLTDQGKKVAVLAVDPSSSLSKGSILGDKTRMQSLARDENAFIRPSPAGDSLGGVAQKTKEAMVLCEAAGYDIILVETVGVGQSETAVHAMVDFFLLLKLAGSGDELQGIKRGIIEMADAIVINKADAENEKQAKWAKAEFTRALHLYPPKKNGWTPKVLTCSALNKIGIDDIWQLIGDFVKLTKENDSFAKKRSEQNKNWFLQGVNERLKRSFYSNKSSKRLLKKYLVLVENGEMAPSHAIRKLFFEYEKAVK
ncbi:methylmalonyl Co-A mutase-associated GTPase MeaB [Allomuricauda sp. SCSIO 65647]|uniref:methylmalonyl Co-A mutase-associated GTPase MeaB n=1 Tax=Allomuricauda sp. SCSIO 65647 TaxID=2908843 RepID=UPI001F22A5F9|nr:methylmalonyl Co-A mutase-associated GTPase MeaB [Muricauda sp. SCSIO 65647]UJH66846.1 methylmalonyl Co-A mutase-associated GTPase MeaB [Muricauda sp. SCSIO 65647]